MVEVKRTLGLGPDLLAAIIAVVLAALPIAMWTAPRAAIPTELPPLALEAREVRAAIAQEHALAARAPEDELATRRLELYRAQNLAELAPSTRRDGGAQRRELRALLTELTHEHGATVIDAVRASDVEAMVRALRGEGDDATRSAAMGAFPASLERWGAVVGGRRVAPEIVVRALFAARWNALHGLALTEGLDGVRARAYHGWLAFHGDLADLGMRAAALDEYQRAGGAHADEVRGVLSWRAGDWESAQIAFDRAYAQEGTLRLRNHAIAAGIAASAGPP